MMASSSTSNKKNILCIAGTRPEAIKMAPLIKALQQENWANVFVLASGQHQELLDSAFESFGVSPDENLAVMTAGQNITDVAGQLVTKFGNIMRSQKTDLTIAQGDTTTVLAASIASFACQVPFAHLEAGLRSGDLDSPFPEEYNRRVVAQGTTLHFAPTQKSAQNLLDEGLEPTGVFNVGNTVIDAVRIVLDSQKQKAPDPTRSQILLTLHRRENFGEPARKILTAIRELVEERAEIDIIYPVHPNPKIRSMAEDILGTAERVTLAEPLEYPDLLQTMRESKIILTDSGGIQEEAPFIGRPVLVLRTETERPEALNEGLSLLIGSDGELLKQEVKTLLDDAAHYQNMSRKSTVFGDGYASKRITDILQDRLAGSHL